MPDRTPLLSTKEVAERLGLPPKTLEEWRRLGRNLPHVKLGRLVRYRPADVEKFIEKNLKLAGV